MKNSAEFKSFVKGFLPMSLIVIVFMYYSPQPLRADGIDIATGIIAGMGLWMLSWGINLLSNRIRGKGKEAGYRPEKRRAINLSRKNCFKSLAFLFVYTLYEELLFRSFILTLCLVVFPTWLSVAINAGLFYLIHFDDRYISLPLSAICYCILTLATGSILPSLIAHVLYNKIVFLTKKNV